MKQVLKIEIGQRFQSIGAVTRTPAFAYEVQGVYRSKIDQVAYARLVLVGDPTQTKSISVATLLNPAQFRPLPSAPESQSKVA